MQFFVPKGVGAAQAGGPHQLKVALENCFHFERFAALSLDPDYCARLFRRHKKSFHHRKRIAGIEDAAGFRSHRDRARQRFRGNDVALIVKSQGEIAKNLQRIDPSLELSGFVSKQSRARADGVEKFPRAHRAREFEA